MEKERLSISMEGVNRLEYAVNYILHNIVSLNYLCGDMCEGVCNLDGNETERINAIKFVKDSGKFRALVYSMGDMLEDVTVLLESVIGEMYGTENGKADNDNVK